MLEKIKEAGIIGAGGSGFPTYSKLKSQCELVIINGAECEPLVYSDQYLMKHFADEIIKGIEYVIELVSAKQVIIGIKAKYKEAIAALESSLAYSYKNIKIHLLRDFYPAGDEQVLVYETTGKIVPEGSIPITIGIVVLNAATVRNIYQCLSLQQPVISRFVTVTGEVKVPKTINLPIGTLVEDAIEFCGGESISDYAVIDGGPMMGAISEGFIKKTTAALLVLPVDSELVKYKTSSEERINIHGRSVCDQCFACTEVCPRYLLGHSLEPHLVMQDVCHSIGLEENPQSKILMSYLCSFCDLCRVWGCPAGISPGAIMKHIVSDLRTIGIKNPYRKIEVQPRNFREGRLPSVKKLLTRLGLSKYDKKASFEADLKEVKVVKISLTQHIGYPCTPVVAIGEKVIKGQIVANVKQEELGTPVHSSIDGIVTDSNKKYIEIREYR